MSFCFAVVRGRLSSRPQVREFESGAQLATLQVTIRKDGQPTISLPVSLWDPPAFVADLVPGDEVVGIGSVHRRFYGSQGGARQSKVEIVASELVRGVDKRNVAAALRRARTNLEAAIAGA